MIPLLSIIETFPGPVWVQDKSGQIIWSNDTYRRLTGLTGAAADTAIPYGVHIHPEDRDRFLMAVIESTRVGGWTALSARIAGWPGGYQPFHIQLCSYTDPEEGSARWLAMGVNAQPARRLEEGRPVAGESKFALALRAAGMTVWEWDVLTNEIVLQDWGRLFPVATGEPVRLGLDGFLGYLHQEDAARLRSTMDRALIRPEPFQIELRLALPDAAERWVCLSAAGDQPASGSHFTGILCDTTPHRLHQRQMDEFIGIASHEIRTPVSSIKAYSQLLQKELTTGQPTENGARIVDRLVYQADRLSGLIRQLLDTTRISEHQLALSYGWFDWETMVQHCIDAVASTDGEQRIHFENGAAGRVYADENRLQQACLNLITNALKFSGADKPVIVRTSREGSQVGFSVKDEGEGIDESMAERLFEPFVQGGPSSPRSHSGLGLGLYITAGIIRRHGGEIGVDSKPGKGALFFFSIPAGGGVNGG